MKLLHVLLLASVFAIPGATVTQSVAPPKTMMCKTGELIFYEDFDPQTLSDRWWFKADFALRDGALLRTNVDPNDSKRVFLKDASFYNTVIQFDFKLSGQTTDLRLVTGSGGGYNSVTQIHPNHFEINTPLDRDAGIVPSQVGECKRKPSNGEWQTMTVEYWNDEIVAHLNEKEIVFGKHPIIDRTRKYFAFQFDLPGASIDNIRVWKATGQRGNWRQTRKNLVIAQANRAPVDRNPVERYKLVYKNLKSRLTLTDPKYRELVKKHEQLQAALHADYPEAFKSHKQLSKLIAEKKKAIRANEPEFKKMESEVHKASRAEDAYVLSKKPELASLKNDDGPKQRYFSELGQVRAKLESSGDEQLAKLVAETARRQTALEKRFPEAFQGVEAAVDNRNFIRKSLSDDPVFQRRNKAIVNAGKAIKAYEEQAEPNLAILATDAKAHANSLKSSGEK